MRCLLFASMLVAVGIVVLGNVSGTSAQSDNCGGNVRSIMSKCNLFFKREGPNIPPSKECCHELKNVDITCFLCKNFLSPSIRPKLSLGKAMYVARSCGCSVPHRFYCPNSLWTAPRSPPVEKAPNPKSSPYLQSASNLKPSSSPRTASNPKPPSSLRTASNPKPSGIPEE